MVKKAASFYRLILSPSTAAKHVISIRSRSSAIRSGFRCFGFKIWCRYGSCYLLQSSICSSCLFCSIELQLISAVGHKISHHKCREISNLNHVALQWHTGQSGHQPSACLIRAASSLLIDDLIGTDESFSSSAVCSPAHPFSTASCAGIDSWSQCTYKQRIIAEGIWHFYIYHYRKKRSRRWSWRELSWRYWNFIRGSDQDRQGYNQR